MTIQPTHTILAVFQPGGTLADQPEPCGLLAGQAGVNSTATARAGVIAASGTVARLGDEGLCAIVGSPCWENPSLAAIADKQGDSAALARAYSEQGDTFCEQLTGAYSFVVIDGGNSRLLAGIDRMGRHTLYFQEVAGGLVVGSTATDVLSYAGGGELNPQSIYNYFYFHMVPSPVSVYRDINKLPAAGCITHTSSGVQRFQHWKPDFSNRGTESPGNLSESLREQLRAAVKRSIAATGSTGTFLSGGLDSSTVTGMLAEVSDNTHPAYAIGFDEPGYDEMPFARISAKHFGVELREYYVTPEDVLQELPAIANSYDEPFGNSSALPAYFCARKAREDGITCLLAGDGGDELFAGNSRYAKQQVFEVYVGLPGALKAGLVDPLVAIIPESIRLGSKLHSYLRQAKIPLPDRLQTYNYLNRTPVLEMFSEDFIEQINTTYPQEIQRQTYHSLDQASDLSRMLYLDWQYTLADNDLRKVSNMCALAGISVCYPMLDDELVEFSLRVPDRLKLKRGNLRHFFKSSLSGWLPQATIDKKKQGFGLPFGNWMQNYRPLSDMANEALVALKQREIFKPEFVDQVQKWHSEDHAAYYGELIWVMTVFELWLQGREEAARLTTAVSEFSTPIPA